MPRVFPAVCLAAAIAAAAACESTTDPSKNQVETFTGKVDATAAGGSGVGDVHPFTVKTTGQWTAVVIALSPATTASFGIAYGQSSGGQCSIITLNANSKLNTSGLGGGISPGTYCVAVYDTGNFTVTENYTLSVSHP